MFIDFWENEKTKKEQKESNVQIVREAQKKKHERNSNSHNHDATWC